MNHKKDLADFYSLMMKDIAQNSSLKEELETSSDADSLSNKLLKMVHEKGYTVTPEEIRNALYSETDSIELNDELLVLVAGGKSRCLSCPDPTEDNRV